MTDIIYNPFRGELAREQKLNKANTYALCAINTLLHDGSLRPYPCPELVCEHGFTPHTIFETDHCDCVAFDSCTQIAQYNNFIYFKEENQRAQKATLSNFCDDVTCNVGLPCPSSAPTVSGSGSGCDYDPRKYMYTFVAKHGDTCAMESPPSPISQDIACGGPVSIGDLDSPPSGYCITHIRIYRISSGWKSGEESTVENNSGSLLVAEIPAGAGGATDDLPLETPSMTSLMTYDMESMPTDPDGLGVTAFSSFSWEDKELFISVDGMPDVRLHSGRYCFEHKIVTAQYWNNSIYVFTERYIYRIDERASRGGVVSYSNPPHRFEKILPIRSKCSVSVGNMGVFYESTSGVAVISGNDIVSLGSSFFSTDQWKSLRNNDIRTHVYNQHLFVYSPEWDYTHIFEFEDGVFTDIEYSNHTRYPYSIQDMYTTNDGELLFASGENTYRFVEEHCDWEDGCDDDGQMALCTPCCPYDYRLRPRSDLEITDYSSAYLHIDPLYGTVVFRLWDGDCGESLVFEAEFGGCGEHEFKLPAGCISKNHTIQLTGCSRIFELRLSTSNKSMGRN